MDLKKIEQLLEAYFVGETTLEQEKQLRDYFKEADEIPDHLSGYVPIFRDMDGMESEGAAGDPYKKIDFTDVALSPGKHPDPDVYSESFIPKTPPRVSEQLRWVLQIAAGIILMLTGFSAGLLVNMQTSDSSGEEIAVLSSEIQEMRDVLMFGSFRQASASERLSAVNMSTRFSPSGGAGEELIGILVHTVNNDKNINVRLAAADALYPYRDESRVRRALIESLSRQNDPLMQLTLIDMLVSMDEKSAVSEMQKLLISTETHEIVRASLQESIAELMT